jgi:hypothetical protein
LRGAQERAMKITAQRLLAGKDLAFATLGARRREKRLNNETQQRNSEALDRRSSWPAKMALIPLVRGARVLMSVWRKEEENVSNIKHDTDRDNESGNFSLLINSTQSRIYTLIKMKGRKNWVHFNGNDVKRDDFRLKFYDQNKI